LIWILDEQFQKEEPQEPQEPEIIHPIRNEVMNQETFESICFNKNKNCIIALLDPTNSDVDEHSRYLNLMEMIQSKYEKFFNFIWIDGVKQSNFAEEFHLASGFPTIMVFNHKKMTVVPYVGSFSEKTIGEFLDKILHGTVRGAVKIQSPPKLIESKKDEL